MAGDWRYTISYFDSYVYVHLSSLSRVFFGLRLLAEMFRAGKDSRRGKGLATVYSQ